MNTSELRPALAVAVLALTACSGPITTDALSNKEPEKVESPAPAVPVTAKTAFWEMYKSAHAWAPDMLPLTLEAKTIPGIKNEGGKAAMWEATFGSPSKKEYSRFTYAVTAHPPDIRKGVAAAEALPWAGLTRDALAFQSAEFVVDSDEAYKTALAKAGPWMKEHPDVPLNTLSMGAASRFPGPVWYFLWGDKKLGFFQLISASTGKALR
jgi:hypothetical protein